MIIRNRDSESLPTVSLTYVKKLRPPSNVVVRYVSVLQITGMHVESYFIVSNAESSREAVFVSENKQMGILTLRAHLIVRGANDHGSCTVCS